MAVTWAQSADKHDVAHEGALHAVQNSYLHVENLDQSRVPGRGRPTLFIGPPRQLGGPLIEVMVEEIAPRDLHVFHVMPARAKCLDLLKRKGGPMSKGTEAEYHERADWAENEMDSDPDAPGVLYGAQATQARREMVARALGGRPPLDQNAPVGQDAKNRTVRLPGPPDAGLVAVAAQQHRRPSDVLRNALTEYVIQHQAS